MLHYIFIMNISVIGLGYVGLVTAACLAELGHNVLGIDIDINKINLLTKDRQIPIYEPGLKELVFKNVDEGRLNYSNKIDGEIDKSVLVFLAVGTPAKEDGTPDISYIYKAIDSIVANTKTYKIFIVKSTAPIGTNLEIKKYLSKKLKTEFDVASNPEFLREGTAVQDFMKPDRIVVGTDNIKVAEIMKDLYSSLTRNGHPILIMDPISSETVKYASNLMLALKVAYINELALLSDSIGADIRRVREGVISDPRIGSQFLYPSIGFGGSCLPKDVQAIEHFCKENSLNLLIPKTVLEANEKQSKWFISKIVNWFGESNIKNKTLAIWGTSFKAGTDDIRESPALRIIEGLASKVKKLKLFDPVALSNTKKYFEGASFFNKLDFVKNENESIQGSDGLVVCTEWLQFRNPDFEKLTKELKDKVIFDGRNLYDSEKLKHHGLNHIGVGIPESKIKVMT